MQDAPQCCVGHRWLSQHTAQDEQAARTAEINDAIAQTLSELGCDDPAWLCVGDRPLNPSAPSLEPMSAPPQTKHRRGRLPQDSTARPIMFGLLTAVVIAVVLLGVGIAWGYIP